MLSQVPWGACPAPLSVWGGTLHRLQALWGHLSCTGEGDVSDLHRYLTWFTYLVALNTLMAHKFIFIYGNVKVFVIFSRNTHTHRPSPLRLKNVRMGRGGLPGMTLTWLNASTVDSVRKHVQLMPLWRWDITVIALVVIASRVPV